jgi:hypothetical protein
MRRNPCQKLENEFKQAALEFLQADQAIKSFNQSSMLQGAHLNISHRDQEKLVTAIKKLEDTREKLSCINQELLKCKQDNQI